MRIEHLDHVPLDGADGVALSALAPGVDPERTRVDIAMLAPGAMLPRHPAGRDQDLYVLAGDGQVAGEDDVAVDVGSGALVHWEAGEQHTTWAVSDLVVVIVQRGPA